MTPDQPSLPATIPAAQLPVLPPQLAAAVAELSGQEMLTLTNLDMAVPTEAAWYVAALGKSDADLQRDTPRRFLAWRYIAHPVQVLDRQTGEIQWRMRVVLFDREGHSFGWSSPITTRFFAAVLRAVGRGPWQHPVELTITPQAGRDSGHWYQLGLVVPEASQPQKKGK